MAGIIDNEQFLLHLTGHQRRLVGYLRMLVPNRDDAEEVLQETNLYLCRHADEFQLGTDFNAWALKVAHFCVLTWRGRQSRDRLIFDDALLGQLAIAAKGFDANANRHQSALESCLKKLSPAEHEMITSLYSNPEATPQNIAASVGKSPKGIYVLLKRIRLKLMACVERTLVAEDHAV